MRALQEKEIIRVGENKARKVDVRIVSATNKDLKAMIERGEFRSDLYYRLAEEPPLVIPPLHERPDDLTTLTETFLKQFSGQYKVKTQLDAEALDALRAYGWPGNVRQLKGVVKHLVLTSARKTREVIGKNDLPEEIRQMANRSDATQTDAIPTAEIPIATTLAAVTPATEISTVKPYINITLSEAILSSLLHTQSLPMSTLVDHIGRDRYAVKRQLKKLEAEGIVRILHRRGRGGNIIHLLSSA